MFVNASLARAARQFPGGDEGCRNAALLPIERKERPLEAEEDLADCPWRTRRAEDPHPISWERVRAEPR